jgi:hypothetical protein
MNSLTRYASHSGDWYDDNPIMLSKELSKYLSASKKYEQSDSLKSIIVPHSGLCYGGPVAAKAFINVNPDNFNRAVILGPSHYEYFKGCALTSFEKFETPFGNVDVDTETINNLLKDSKHFFSFPQSSDVQEHSIEMEMPFLKYIFDKRKLSIIPMVIGDGNLSANTQLAKCLYNLYEDPKTLFVISSDFCHWGPNFDYVYYNKKFKNIWESTEDLDRQALDIIAQMDSKKFDMYMTKTKNTICGSNPITIILSIIEEYQKKHQDKKLSFESAGYAQSSKVKSMNDSSVSYAAGVNFII